MLFPSLFVTSLILATTLVEAADVSPLNPGRVSNRKRCKACKKRHQQGTTTSALPLEVNPSTSLSASSSTATASSSSLSSSNGTATPRVDATTITSTVTRSSPTTKTSTTERETPTTTADGNNTPSNDGSDNIAYVGTGKTYTVSDRYAGQSFFDGFNFETFPDPTHGNVNYLSRDAAFGAGLAYVENGQAVMKVDDYSWVDANANRNSVRISSKKPITSGLLVLDVASMPYGCGVWPAFWTVGDNWPNGGEIDILEGVHDSAQAQYTLHTAPGCQLDTSLKTTSKKRALRRHAGNAGHPHAGQHVPDSQPARRALDNTSPLAGGLITFSGSVLRANCDATIDSNLGCGIQDPNKRSYGSALNGAGGGIFATLLDDHGVAIWFFPRDSIPEDLKSDKPRPSTWGSPKALWSSSQCPTNQFFKEQKIVINTTLCGDWAGNTYSAAGCPGTCGQRVSDPNNFKTASWKINSVTIFN